MSYFFLSDLHLSKNTPKICNLLLKFLQNEAHTAKGIFIMGDLFEYWVGDDLPHKWFFPITQELNRLADKGINLIFLHGNRDFLINNKFLTNNKLKLLSDPYKITLYNIPILLSHGDIFCTNDKSYIRFRKLVQTNLFRKIFLNIPLKIREIISKKTREKSELKKSISQAKTMDVNDFTVKNYLEKYHCYHLIHGHTHKPNIHEIKLDNGINAMRYVLGDWHDNSAVILRLDENGKFNLYNLC